MDKKWTRITETGGLTCDADMLSVYKETENFENIKDEDIVISFAGTSKTFSRYINRSNCGGKAITAKNIFQLPSCNTHFEGLYNVGDTVFAGQGWPGVAIGVEVLNKELNRI